MTVDKERLASIRARLGTLSVRLTPQRAAILDVFLERPGSHLAAEQVYDLVRADHPDLGLATVYRTVDVLATNGVLRRLDLGDGRAHYELSGHDQPHYHHHLVCLACGAVRDVYDDRLAALERRITAQSGFTVVDHHLIFYGYCARCGVPTDRSPQYP